MIEFREENIVPKTTEKDGREKQTTELKKLDVGLIIVLSFTGGNHNKILLNVKL